MGCETVSFPVTREFETEVLVCGGGVAGFAAAVSAGRTGAKILLADFVSRRVRRREGNQKAPPG